MTAHHIRRVRLTRDEVVLKTERFYFLHFMIHLLSGLHRLYNGFGCTGSVIRVIAKMHLAEQASIQAFYQFAKSAITILVIDRVNQ